jgi:hypothetical protein
MLLQELEHTCISTLHSHDVSSQLTPHGWMHGTLLLFSQNLELFLIDLNEVSIMRQWEPESEEVTRAESILEPLKQKKLIHHPGFVHPSV